MTVMLGDSTDFMPTSLLLVTRTTGLYDPSLSKLCSNTSIEVEEPIDGHWLSCGEELTVRTDQPINCFSKVTYGSNVEFSWTIFNDYFLVSAAISNDNLTSSALIVFEQPGKYNITVFRTL
jgi:hypothetical protein